MTNQQFHAELYGIRDQLIDLIDRHRAECTEIDCAQHVHTTAYLAHAVGVKKSDGAMLMHEIDEYQRTCPNCTSLN